MTDWGAQHFDIAQWRSGMDHTDPVEIIPPDGQDRKQLTLKDANGVTVHQTGYDAGQGVTFIGSEVRVSLMAGSPADRSNLSENNTAILSPFARRKDVLSRSERRHCSCASTYALGNWQHHGS